MSSITFKTQLTAQECLRRLAQNTVQGRLEPSQSGILAELQEQSFCLQLQHANWRNSFSRLLYATLHPAADGTTLVIRIKMHSSTAAFAVVWFAIIGVIGTLMFVTSLGHLTTGVRDVDGGSPWVGVVLPPLLLAFGILLTRTGRGDGHELIKFVARILEARDAAGSA